MLLGTRFGWRVGSASLCFAFVERGGGFVGKSGGNRTAQVTSAFLATAERFAPLRRLGWAFLLAWVFCVFYTDAAGGRTGAQVEALAMGMGWHLLFAGLPVAMSVVTLALVVGLERRLGSPIRHPALFWVAPMATAVSTPLLFCELPDLFATAALFVAGAVLTGFGSGLMWVMWGEYYAKVTQEETEFLAPSSAVLAAVLVLLVSAMDGWVTLAVVTAFPLVSGLCLALSWCDVAGGDAAGEYLGPAERRAYAQAHDDARTGLSRVFAAMGRAGFGILAACLFVCLEGSFWVPAAKNAPEVQAAFLVSIAFMLAVGLSATAGPRRVSLSFLYRWMCPALVIGFAALIVLGDGAGAYAAYVVAIAARFAFCLITQMYFARYAVQGAATPVQSYGLGWIFVHLGDLLGVLAIAFADAGVAAGAFGVDQVAAVSMALLVVSTMFVLNDGRSFSFGSRSDKRVSVAEEGGRCRAWAGIRVGACGAGGCRGDDLTARIRELAAGGGLTPRETEVFDLLARGRSVPYVRDALVISRETAATHAKHVYAKLGVHSRQELIDLVTG